MTFLDFLRGTLNVQTLTLPQVVLVRGAGADRKRLLDSLGAARGVWHFAGHADLARAATDPLGGVLLGLAGGIICYAAVDLVKHRLRIDDSLDVMAVHGVGGITGTLLTGFLATAALGGVGLEASVLGQFWVQLVGVAVTVAWSAVATFGLVKLTQMTVGLRVCDESELQGLDLSEHGETGYRL